jgi:hypothetical protein
VGVKLNEYDVNCDKTCRNNIILYFYVRYAFFGVMIEYYLTDWSYGTNVRQFPPLATEPTDNSVDSLLYQR